jgi:cellulose synthase/poly-beta-1,6-N-acetylglucosamine synthase-like glycosyltransferase
MLATRVRVMLVDELPRRRRVARLSLLAVALIALTLLLLVLAAWVALREDPKDIVGQFPLGAGDNVPSISLILAAGAAVATVFMGLAALHAAAAMRVLARDRRLPGALSPEARRLRALVLTPLGPSSVRLVNEPELPAGKLPDPNAADAVAQSLRLTVLVPAHDEALTIGATLESLCGQTRRPDKVVVVADNCTDDTAGIARRGGAEVFTTVGNSDKKAGALNQALAEMFEHIETRDVVMIMDADSVIVPEFLQTAMGRLEADPDLIAVGGVFYGEEGSGLVGQLQRSEFTRYQRYISRRRGKVFVLTGTASLLRTYALKAVADSRGELLPGDPGRVYDTLAMTEDNEMTLALKTLGAKMVSPMQCRVVTEVMPTLRALWRQRMRWQRGALENIGAYGLTRATLIYWLQQLGIGYGTIALNAYLFLMLVTVLAADEFQLVWFWVAIGMIFVVERVVTVWAAGWRGRALAAPLVIELAYDLMLQAVYVKSLLDIATGRASGWNYVPREAVPRQAVSQ